MEKERQGCRGAGKVKPLELRIPHVCTSSTWQLRICEMIVNGVEKQMKVPGGSMRCGAAHCHCRYVICVAWQGGLKINQHLTEHANTAKKVGLKKTCII